MPRQGRPIRTVGFLLAFTAALAVVGDPLAKAATLSPPPPPQARAVRAPVSLTLQDDDTYDTAKRILHDGFGVDYIPERHGMGLWREHPSDPWTLYVSDAQAPPEDRLIAQGQFLELGRFLSLPMADVVKEMGTELSDAGLSRHETYFVAGEIVGPRGSQGIAVAEVDEFDAPNTPVQELNPVTMNVFFPIKDQIDPETALQLAEQMARPLGYPGVGGAQGAALPACLVSVAEQIRHGSRLAVKDGEDCEAEYCACRDAAVQAFKNKMKTLLKIVYIEIGTCLVLGLLCTLGSPLAGIVCLAVCAIASVWIDLDAVEAARKTLDKQLQKCKDDYDECLAGGARAPAFRH